MAERVTYHKYHRDIGQVNGRTLHKTGIITQSAIAEYTDISGTKYYPIRLPKGATIIDCWVDMIVAFNSGTTDVVDIGTKLCITGTEDVDSLIDNQDAQGAAGTRYELATGAAEATFMVALTEDTWIVVTTTRAGTAATAGTLRLVVQYVCDLDEVDAVDYGA